MILEEKRLAKEEQEGKGLKILTPNQMLKKNPNSSCTNKSR